jgi:hypothetical protein
LGFDNTFVLVGHVPLILMCKAQFIEKGRRRSFVCSIKKFLSLFSNILSPFFFCLVHSFYVLLFHYRKVNLVVFLM